MIPEMETARSQVGPLLERLGKAAHSMTRSAYINRGSVRNSPLMRAEIALAKATSDLEFAVRVSHWQTTYQSHNELALAQRAMRAALVRAHQAVMERGR